VDETGQLTERDDGPRRPVPEDRGLSLPLVETGPLMMLVGGVLRYSVTEHGGQSFAGVFGFFGKVPLVLGGAEAFRFGCYDNEEGWGGVGKEME
jgi:hypothetical protein